MSISLVTRLSQKTSISNAILILGIWAIIKGWLDPVVASKVHFTKTVQDLEAFIPRDRIIKELDGPEKWEYSYPPPVPSENDKMKDTETRDSIFSKRKELTDAFEEASLTWISASYKKDTPLRESSAAKRSELIKKLENNYWDLDPYIRAVSLYDRLGIVQPGGKIDFYPNETKAAAVTNGTNGTNGESKKWSDDFFFFFYFWFWFLVFWFLFSMLDFAIEETVLSSC